MVEHVDVQVKNTDAAPLAVVLLSGGLDSMVCAGLALEQGFRVLALTIDYNQRHRIELDAARKIAARLRWIATSCCRSICASSAARR
jgi:7-cyano-7-deazaguanine synthase